MSYSLFTAIALLSSSMTHSKIPPECDPIFIPYCDKQLCCHAMGGISYCDSVAGRYVCNNGYYSTCYCTRHAVMNLQKLSGCCLWQGGVMAVNELGNVVCNNGSISEVCSLQNPTQQVSSW
ncbi:hypothetical protein [Legionella maceachernii]|uniref:hypothetical protein n=1 Tax=Legionella maceachernii TaxID=466 RepID=UPI001BE0195A|nr:hypothetical protein [Legionella maceachernii]